MFPWEKMEAPPKFPLWCLQYVKYSLSDMLWERITSIVLGFVHHMARLLYVASFQKQTAWPFHSMQLSAASSDRRCVKRYRSDIAAAGLH